MLQNNKQQVRSALFWSEKKSLLLPQKWEIKTPAGLAPHAWLQKTIIQYEYWQSSINTDANITGYTKKKFASEIETNPNKQRLSYLYDRGFFFSL